MPTEPRISSRQREVGTMLADGLSAAEVAERLGIDQGTVENHRALLYRTLGISNVVELTHYALSRAWLRNKFATRGRPRKNLDA